MPETQSDLVSEGVDQCRPERLVDIATGLLSAGIFAQVRQGGVTYGMVTEESLDTGYGFILSVTTVDPNTPYP